MSDDATGYRRADYAAAVARGGEVQHLPRSGGFLIRRPVPGTMGFTDAMAPYPFLCCAGWNGLADDLAELPPDIVTVTAVTDPFADLDAEGLSACFNAMARPYKQHFTIRLDQPLESFADPRKIAYARGALRKADVECCANPGDHMEDFLRLYGVLVERHGIRGAGLMDEASLRAQAEVPGFRLFRAVRQGRTIAMVVIMERADTGYFHFILADEEGYRCSASYALVRVIADTYRQQGFRALSIGAGAGAFGSGDDGLTAFKRAWSSGSRTAFLCGHIRDRAAYDSLTAAKGQAATSYFPAYRAGEYD